MRYTVDPIEGPETDDLVSPFVVEVQDVEHDPARPIVGPGDRDVGQIVHAGAPVGRFLFRLTSEDPEIGERVEPLRKALRELRDQLEIDLTPHTEDGQELESAEAEAEYRTESAFSTLLAYAALAVELETERG